MNDMKAFITQLESKTAAVQEEINQLQWDFAISGDSRFQSTLVDKEMELHTIFSNPEDYKKVKEWRKHAAVDEPTRRILNLIYLQFLSKQESESHARRKIELDVEIAGHYANFRSKIGKEELTANDIKNILRDSNDEAYRKKVWEASKQIGPIVHNLILERVGICNSIAQDLGFRDYYTFQLELQETEEHELYSLLDRLDALTKEPFEKLKEQLDRKLISRFGLSSPRDLRPWHYNDPFFQEAPPLTDLDLNPFYEGKSLEELTVQTFDRVGLDIRPTLEQSDLYERAGKDQHAFCLKIGRDPDKVKILCNCRPDAYWMGTMLHEFGHGIYDQSLDTHQPYFLRDIAHINTTEAMAMLFGRLTHNKEWMIDILGVDPEEVEKIAPLAERELSWQMLLITRWILVMVHFERALYANPSQDVNALWWDLVEKYQHLVRPESRQMPDWATKIHIALHPVYYHNYLLGEMTASQIQHHIETKLGQKALIRQPKTGPWLMEKLFKQGALRPWNDALQFLTGEKLNPNYFVKQYLTTK